MKIILAIVSALFLSGCAPCLASELEVVYKTIAMESANQPFEGQVAVAGVILERSRQSGKSLEAVCLAKKQFSCWNSRKWAFSWLSRNYDAKVRSKAIRALETAINASQAYRGVRHYHAKGVRPAWAKGHEPAFVIGEHLFYRGIK